MNFKLRYCLPLLVFVLVAQLDITKAQSLFVIEDDDRSLPLADHLEYLVDTLDLSIREVVTKRFDRELPNSFYAAERTLWIKAQVANSTQNNQFVLTCGQWSHATLFVSYSNRWTTLESGTEIPVGNRPLVLHRLLSFPIVIEPDDSVTLYLKLRLTKPLIRYYGQLYRYHERVEIDEASHAYKKYMGNQLLVMFIMGVVSILFIYTLSLYLFEKQLTSLILAVYFVCVTLGIADVHGIATLYLFPTITAFEMPLSLHLAFLTSISMALFLLTFFRFGRRSWESYALVGFTSFLVVVWLLSSINDRSYLYFERRYIEYAVFIAVTLSATVKRSQGGVVILVAMAVTMAASYYGDLSAVFVPGAILTSPDRPYLWSVLVQVIIFSVAASYRVRNLTLHVELMKVERRRLIEEQNKILKIQVDEKTKQLQEALQTLKSQADELESANKLLTTNSEDLKKQSVFIQNLNNQLEQLVDERTQALRETMQDLDTFLYRTSHDIRRPLMTILGLSNLITGARELDEIRQLNSLIRTNIFGLDRMLKKLIVISACYHDSVDFENVNLEEAIEDAISTIRSHYASEALNIEFVNQAAGAFSETDGYLVNAILISVLENAIQYGGKGVGIAIELLDVDDNLKVIIRDNGLGIDPQLVSSVFEMFTRASEKSIGNGLGLYLTKIAMAKLGGSVSLTSEVGCTEVTLFFRKTLGSARITT